MSTIDKALPNVVENTVKTPSDEEVAIAEEQVAESQGGEGVDVQENEDGSVDINFEPNKVNQPSSHTVSSASLQRITTSKRSSAHSDHGCHRQSKRRPSS
jgi:hypothetical protein